MDAPSLMLLAGIALASFVLSFYGSAVGLILGHLRLPLLIYLLPSTTAGMATNLAISGMGAMTGTFKHAREGRISLSMIFLMGIPSVIGAAVGAVLLLKVDSEWARLVIGGFLTCSGLNLIFSVSSPGGSSPVFGALRWLVEVIIGLVIGFLATVTGLMLGSVRVPMMIRLLKIDPRVAVGTNMAIGCLTAFAGAGSLWRGESFYLLPILIAGPATILGAYLGARYTGHFRKEVLQRLVGLTIALTGLGMTGEGVWKALLS
jgi:uncharacterized membrane protein YfcA